MRPSRELVRTGRDLLKARDAHCKKLRMRVSAGDWMYNAVLCAENTIICLVKRYGCLYALVTGGTKWVFRVMFEQITVHGKRASRMFFGFNPIDRHGGISI